MSTPAAAPAAAGTSAAPTVEPSIENADVVTKYKTAAGVVNEAIEKVLAAAVAGASVLELCKLGDSLVEAAVEPLYKKGKTPKGLAFPTCVSVNNVIGHFSPLEDDKTVLAEGDMVKVDMGVHIDNYPAYTAGTIVVGASTTEPLTGRKADVMLAAYTALEAAARVIKDGESNSHVSAVICKAAESFNCSVVQAVSSHQIVRFAPDNTKTILNNNKNRAEAKVEPCKFATHEVYQLDIVTSTGPGRAAPSPMRTTVYKKHHDQNYQLKMAASRKTVSEIKNKFGAFPFSLRELENQQQAKLGITECVKHKIVSEYPILKEDEGNYVAQFKFTLLIMPNGTLKITGVARPNAVSEHKVEDEEVLELLATSLSLKKKAKKNKKKKAAE